MADSNNVNVSEFSFLIWFMLQACIISAAKLEEQWMEIQQEREVHWNDFTLWSNCSISSKIKYSKICQAHLNLPLNPAINNSVYNDFLTVLVFVGNFQKIASIFKCETSSSLSLLNCLRKQEAEHLVFNSQVGETSWQQNFLMAHLQNFSSASDQSSLMVCSKVDFSYLLSKYFLNVEIISHWISLCKFRQCRSTCKVVSKVWASLCFNVRRSTGSGTHYIPLHLDSTRLAFYSPVPN